MLFLNLFMLGYLGNFGFVKCFVVVSKKLVLLMKLLFFDEICMSYFFLFFDYFVDVILCLR